NVRKEKTMANVYVEARPKGRPEGSAIQDYVVEDHANHELGTFKSQKEAIDWAKAKGHAPLVARVRHLNDKKNPDHWRSAQGRSRRGFAGLLPSIRKVSASSARPRSSSDSQMATHDLSQICVFQRDRERELFAAVAPDG